MAYTVAQLAGLAQVVAHPQGRIAFLRIVDVDPKFILNNMVASAKNPYVSSSHPNTIHAVLEGSEPGDNGIKRVGVLMGIKAGAFVLFNPVKGTAVYQQPIAGDIDSDDEAVGHEGIQERLLAGGTEHLPTYIFAYKNTSTRIPFGLLVCEPEVLKRG